MQLFNRINLFPIVFDPVVHRGYIVQIPPDIIADRLKNNGWRLLNHFPDVEFEAARWYTEKNNSPLYDYWAYATDRKGYPKYDDYLACPRVGINI